MWKADLWSYPGVGTFQMLWPNLPFTDMSVTPRRSRIGEARMILPPGPDIAELTALLLTRDPNTPANDRRSLVRVYRDGSAVPVVEWVPTGIPDTLGEAPVMVSGEVYGPYRLADAIVWPFDWPAWRFPDWVWGGGNVLQNPGFEEGVPILEEQLVWVVGATGGTFTLSDGTDTTGGIAWNASAGTVETRLQNDITAIVDVAVTGSGSAADPWRIQFLNPLGNFTQLIADGTLLTPGGAAVNVSRLVDGQTAQITGWTVSHNIVTGGIHGSHAGNSPRLSIPPGEPADTGTYAAYYNADAPFGGIEQRVSVQPGQVYSGASIRVRPTSGTDPFALVLRDAYEGLITYSPPSATSGTFTAATWATQTLSGLHVIPDGVTELVFRHAYSGSGDAADVLVDNANLTLGLQPATVGEMVRLLVEDAATNHVADGRTVLDNLDLTFTDLLDSDGTAWPRLESMTVTHGQTYFQVLEAFREQLGYDWAVTAKAVVVGALTHDLNVYVPGGMGQDRTADADPAVIIGGGVSAGPVSHSGIVGNAVIAEGSGGLNTRAESAASIGAAGRREIYAPNGSANSQTTVNAVAVSTLDELLAQGLGFAVAIVDGAGPVGLVDYGLADTVNVVHPTLGRQGHRVDSHTLDIGADGVVGTTHFSREILHQEAAVYEGVRRLLARAASQPPPVTAKATRQSDYGTGTGGGFSVRVAASDAGAKSKAAADLVCTGSADHLTIMQAAGMLPTGGEIVLSEGTFNVDTGQVLLPAGVSLRGMGKITGGYGTTVRSTATSGAVLTTAGGAVVRDLTVQGTFGGSVVGIACGAADRLTISRVRLQACSVYISLTSSNSSVSILGCDVPSTSGTFVQSTGGSDALHIAACSSEAAISLTNAVEAVIANNIIRNTLTLSGDRNVIVGNTVGQTYPGISHGAGSLATIIGNVSSGILLTDVEDAVVTGNTLNGAGVNVTACVAVTVAGNTVGKPFDHGITLTDTSDSTVTGNTVDHTAVSLTDNTYDGIHLAGNSDRNHITGNLVIANPSGTHRTRYGINVSAATCDLNSYVGNRATGVFGTAAYNDAGTGTVNVWPGAAAPQGDNLL